MTGWIRCRTCRTLGHLDRGAFCAACGNELRADDPRHDAPELERTASRDVRRSAGMLTGLGVMGVVGMLHFFLWNLGSDWGWGAALGLLLLGGGGLFFLSRRHDPEVAAAGRAILKGFAVVGILFMAGIALVFAGIVFLFVVCATGAWRIGG